MGRIIISIVLIICLWASIQFCPVSEGKEAEVSQQSSVLRVYLPREATVEDDCFNLGQVGILLGEESLVARAGGIALGRISIPGQKVVLDKAVILSRLACSGINASKVKLTGAERVTVQRRQEVIKGKEFVELASSFLQKHQPAGSICQADPTRIPGDLIIPGASKDIQVSSRLIKSRARNTAKVQIIVSADGEQIGTREVIFLLKYNCRRAVTLIDIAEGVAISAQNVKIEQMPADYPEPAGWTAPYGLVARRQIAANSVIRPYMIGPATPPVLLKRNQAVVIRIERPGYLVTAAGKAVQEGRCGEYIKVQNVDSKRIIIARVNEDGTVEPVL